MREFVNLTLLGTRTSLDQSEARKVRRGLMVGNAPYAELSDGTLVPVPVMRFHRLRSASRPQLANMRIVAGGDGLHWPDLDEDISVSALTATSTETKSRYVYSNRVHEVLAARGRIRAVA